jgi:Transglycosylase SLT domain
MRRGVWAAFISGAYSAIVLGDAAGAASKAERLSAEAVQQAFEKKAGSVERVAFPDTGWSPVKIVRGTSSSMVGAGEKPETEKTESAEIVSFGDPNIRPVRVIRGETERTTPMPGQPPQANVMTTQIVTFANLGPVSIIRGSAQHGPDLEPFARASAGDLDRVAFAVDGAESSHGADLRMWRAEPSGPQGPMQVTAAAAIDVGGGDRFDLAANRALGRAYLARLYRRYGNWPDAVAAYNRGPGNSMPVSLPAGPQISCLWKSSTTAIGCCAMPRWRSRATGMR